MDRPRHAAATPRFLVSLGELSRRRPGLIIASAAGVAAAILLSAALALVLGGSSPARAKPADAATLIPRPSPTPRPTHSGPLLDPFTGERVKALGPVLAVKIDNIVYARPQTGLRSADIVYVIPVEGGLTRFMAVFSSHIPTTVGPVRSARQSDLDLLAQFGRPAFAWSGATPHLVPFIERAPFIVDLYANLVNGYWRDPNRIAPYNLFATTKTLMSQAPKASKARDIGFRFGATQTGGKPTASYDVKYPSASYTF